MTFTIVFYLYTCPHPLLKIMATPLHTHIHMCIYITRITACIRTCQNYLMSLLLHQPSDDQIMIYHSKFTYIFGEPIKLFIESSYI